MSAGGTSTVQISHTGFSTLAITGTSSKPSDLQVTPVVAQTVGVGGMAVFTIKSKKGTGTYTIAFASSTCNQKLIGVVIE